MKTTALAALASVVLVAGVADAKDFPRPRHPHHHGAKHHHGFKHRHGFGVGVIAPPIVIYSAPSYVPAYVPSPPAYVPRYAPPPAYGYSPPPMQRVVEFPTGRYELHGDGITTPYRWVWIPNPPTSPPVEEPPAAPPAPPAPAQASTEPRRPATVYRWTDDAGVVHLTDRLEKVPGAYR
jgi:hypothetical protein